MKFKKIYFYGSLPRPGKSPIGGGEVGNSRTIRMLRGFGYEVRVIRKLRVPSSSSKMVRIVSYPFRFMEGILKMFFILLVGNRNAVVHISGFAGATILNEFVLVRITKILGYRLIYELRGGGILENYEAGSRIYKKMFSNMLRKTDYIFSQGKENFPLIEALTIKPVYHYPNCVEKEFYPPQNISKAHDSLNLIFFGRMEPEKNVKLIVEITRILQSKLPNVTLTLIGSGHKSYVDSLLIDMSEKLEKGSYSYSAGCSHDKLKDILMDKHFYIFPSQQIREGQSNAVTEAMSYGIVPIVSNQGFSRSTVGCDELVVDDFSAAAYADKLLWIVNLNKVDYYSQMMQNNFRNFYTEDVVYAKMKAIYAVIIN